MTDTPSPAILRTELNRFAAAQGRLVERILAELEFAQGLAELTQTASWRKRIAPAHRAVAEAARTGRPAALQRAVGHAEQTLAPIGKAAKKYTVHCVGHAHIDMNWMWSWPETVAVTNDTVTTVLALMDEHDDFCFTQSQASVYEIVREHSPELFEQIRRRVREGRWEVVACHWVEGDKNLVGGESLVRHLLYTRRYMAEHLGLAPEDVPLDWEPDTFGHAATIPTIVSGAGVRRYYLCRGGRQPKPPVFWWRGPDGSRILVNLEHTWYNDRIGPHNARGLLSFCRRTGLTDWMLVYGVGDHGGGPTRRDILACHEMDAWPIYPRFRLATTRRYYEALEAAGEKLPVWDQELNVEFTGCYTSQSEIKRGNRLAEDLLQRAEQAAAMAWRTLGRAYPAERLRRAWTDTLFGHFHDILPGSGVRATREYHSALFQRTAAAAGMIETHALRALAAAVDTSFAGGGDDAPGGAAMGAGGGYGTGTGGISMAGRTHDGPRPFVVFNPAAGPRRGVVTFTLWEAEADAPAGKWFRLRTPDGRAALAQRTGHGHYWAHNYVQVAAPVAVASLGYAAVVVEEAGSRPPPGGVGYGDAQPGADAAEGEDAARAFEALEPAEDYRVGHLAMENAHTAAAIDPATGAVSRLADKAAGRELIAAGEPACLEYVVEQAGGMSAWTIHPMKRRVCPPACTSCRVEASGPYVAAVAAEYRIDESTVTVRYVLTAGRPELEIRIAADWRQRGGPDVGTPGLRLCVPLALEGAKALYEIPAGWIERPHNAGQEVPALRWATVYGRCGPRAAAACSVLNDCKHGHSLDGSTLRVSLLRSSYSPDPLPEMGRHEMRLALVPHGGKPSPAALIGLGAQFNQPLQAVATDAHQGALPPTSGPLVAVTPKEIVLTAIKRAEDDGALIVRLLETAGKDTAATVALDAAIFGKVREAVEVDLLERPVASSGAKLAEDGFRVRLPARGIATVRVAFD
jgi:alpha-mannosidase